MLAAGSVVLARIGVRIALLMFGIFLAVGLTVGFCVLGRSALEVAMRLVELALLEHLHVEHIDEQEVQLVSSLVVEELVHVGSNEIESVEVGESRTEQPESMKLKSEIILSSRHVSLDELQHMVVKVANGRIESVAIDRRAVRMERRQSIESRGERRLLAIRRRVEGRRHDSCAWRHTGQQGRRTSDREERRRRSGGRIVQCLAHLCHRRTLTVLGGGAHQLFHEVRKFIFIHSAARRLLGDAGGDSGSAIRRNGRSRHRNAAWPGTWSGGRGFRPVGNNRS